jgi:hypothetical protein
MTNVQLREELFREINPLLDNNTAIRKVLVFLRTISSESQSANNIPKIRLDDLEIPEKLRRKRGCIRLTEEDMKDERIQYIVNR